MALETNNHAEDRIVGNGSSRNRSEDSITCSNWLLRLRGKLSIILLFFSVRTLERLMTKSKAKGNSPHLAMGEG